MEVSVLVFFYFPGKSSFFSNVAADTPQNPSKHEKERQEIRNEFDEIVL